MKIRIGIRCRWSCLLPIWILLALFGCKKKDLSVGPDIPRLKVVIDPIDHRVLEVYSYISDGDNRIFHGEYLRFVGPTVIERDLFDHGRKVELGSSTTVIETIPVSPR